MVRQWLSRIALAVVVLAVFAAGVPSTIEPVNAQGLPGRGDFQMRIPGGWWEGQPLGLEGSWTNIGVFYAPAQRAGDPPPAALFVEVQYAQGPGWSTDLDPRPPLKIFEIGTGCTFDGVSGNACIHIVAGNDRERLRSDAFGIVKNGIAWMVWAIGETAYFDRNRPALEAVMFTFHTDFGAPPALRCVFRFGFKALHDLIPHIVGDCLENEHRDPPTGDTVQATSNGLLIYRPSTNLTWFTDGYRTWILGPCGLQERLNTERFTWEVGQPGCDPVGAAPPAPAPALQPPPSLPAIPRQLRAAWDVLHATSRPRDDLPSLGELVDSWLLESGARLAVGSLPEGVYGRYSGATNTITISALTARDIPEAVAAVLVHELRHAVQRARQDPVECVPREVDAMGWESLAWGELTDGGVQTPTTVLQLEENLQLRVLSREGEPGLYKLVVDNPGYQEECDLWTPG